jgi:predicted secreted protein
MPATIAIQGQGFVLSVLLSPPIAIGQLRTVKSSGSKIKMADITNTNSPSAYEEILPTIISPGTISFTGVLNPSDTSQIELQTLQNNRTLSPWKIELPNAAGNWTFSAYVGSWAWDVDYSKEVTFSGSLDISGPVTYTPSA